MCKYKFKVGDLVRSLDREFTFYGKVGKVTHVDTLYSVLMMHDGNEYSHYEYELELVSAQNGGWMLIDTAPKDGTEVLAVFSNDYGYQKEPTVYGPWTAFYVDGKWYASWDNYFVIDSCGDCCSERRETPLDPTHWMPLPKPPLCE